MAVKRATKRRAKKRTTKSRTSKKRTTKRRAPKRKTTKRRATKKRPTKKRAKKRTTKTSKRKTTRRTKRRSTKRRSSGKKLSYRVREIPVKMITVWKEAQARTLDKEGIRELAKSIRNEGLQNPPMVQKEGKGVYLLMSGQRRLAALKLLRYKKIPALVLAKGFDLENAKAASVIENLHRTNMNAREMANSCAFLAEKMGKAKGAKSLGISMKTFKKYLGFAGVPDQLKDLVPSKISRDNAVKLYQLVPNLNKAIEIANRLGRLDGTTRRKYLEALDDDPRATHGVLLGRARRLSARKTVPVRLSARQARGLLRQSENRDLEPQELAKTIVSSWLSKKGYR